MAGAGEAIGGLAGALPGTLEIPIKVAGEIRAWEEMNRKLQEGGVIDLFPPQNGLLKDQEAELVKAIREAYRLNDKAAVSVKFKPESPKGSRIIPFRAPNSKVKIALRLEWDYKFARVEVSANEDLVVKQDDGTDKVIKAGTPLHKSDIGGFVDNIRMFVHNSTHFDSGDYAFVFTGSVEHVDTEVGPGTVTQIEDVYITLAPHTTKRNFQGAGNLGRNSRTFRYRIAGNKSVTYIDSRGQMSTAPREVPKKGEHFDATDFEHLQKSAARENQGVLFSLSKGEGVVEPVWAIPAKDLKVRTADNPAAPAKLAVKGFGDIDTVIVIGPHSGVLTEYMKANYPSCVEGTLKHSSRRGHGTWTFTGLKALKDGVEKQVRNEFAHGELHKTKKTIRFK